MSLNNSILVRNEAASVALAINDWIRFNGFIIIIPCLAVVGFLMNAVCLLVLTNPKLSGDEYKYQILKTTVHSIVLLITSLSPITNCRVCPTFQTFFAQIIRFLGLAFLNGFAYSSTSLAEIVLTYDRLYMLKQNS
jgi:hypothetical protein